MTIEERVKDYLDIRKNALDLYKTFGRVKCPALGSEYVHFTSEGFNHLIYKGAKKQRDVRSQILRFDLLEKAEFIIEKSTTYQEYDENIENIKVNRHGKWVYENVLVKCWGFIAVIKKLRVKVVIMQKGNGKREFRSVVPAWFLRQYRDIKLYDSSTNGGLQNENDEDVLKNAAQGDVF